MKELRCKKCGKILGVQEGTRISIKGKVQIYIYFEANTCIFTCVRCEQKNIFGIEPLTSNIKIE